MCLKAEPGAAANRMRRSDRRGRKRKGLVPDAAASAASAICHLSSSTSTLSPLPRRLSPERRLFPSVLSPLCSALVSAFFPHMDLVGVASPEPKVSGGRADAPTLVTWTGPLGGPRESGRRLGKLWARPQWPGKGGTGGKAAWVGVGEVGRDPRLPEATLADLGSHWVCPLLSEPPEHICGQDSDTLTFEGKQVRSCFSWAK